MSWYPALGKGPRVWPAVCPGSKSSQLRLLKHARQLPCNAMQVAYRGAKVHVPSCRTHASCRGPSTYKQADPSFLSYIRAQPMI